MSGVPASRGGGGSTFNGGTITNPLVIDLSGDSSDRTALDVIQPATFGFTVRPFRFRQTDFAYLQMETTGIVSTANNDFSTGGARVVTGGGNVDTTPGGAVTTDQVGVLTAGGVSTHQLVGATPGAVGFFGKTDVAQPAAPVTLGDVIAALKTLGLVAT